MGKKFTLVSEGALPSLKPDWTDVCNVCESDNAEIYVYHGTLLDVTDEPSDFEVICDDCIKTRKIEKMDVKQVFHNIETWAKEVEESKEHYTRTPDIYFAQYADWPVCCGELVEFQGNPQQAEELFALPQERIYWERESFEGKESLRFLWIFKVPNDRIPKFDNGLPEELNEVNYFQCRCCEKRYWTFQFT